jgi:hypothetical protein
VGPGPVLLLVYEGIENQSYVFTLSYLTGGDEFTLVDGDAEASKGKTLISKGFPPRWVLRRSRGHLLHLPRTGY